jgi:hypothetical protein
LDFAYVLIAYRHSFIHIYALSWHSTGKLNLNQASSSNNSLGRNNFSFRKIEINHTIDKGKVVLSYDTLKPEIIRQTDR